MKDSSLWNSDWEGIDGYVYDFAGSTKSITFNTNRLYMGGFQMKKLYDLTTITVTDI